MKTTSTNKIYSFAFSTALLLSVPFFSFTQNLLLNSDFNSGNTGWTLMGMNVETNNENIYGGTSTTNIVAEIDGHSGLRQKMALTSGKIYTLVFNASRRTTAGTPVNVAMNVLVVGDVTGNVYINYSTSYTNTVFGYTNESQTFTVPANSTDKAIIIEFSPINNNSNRGVIVDDIEMTATNTNSLPVQLISFTGEIHNDQTILKWKTAAEINNKHFVIERSSNGNQFDSIGTVKAALNNNSSKSYSFVDSKLNTGANFYRLRQVDVDGASKYSKVVIVKWQNGTADIKVFPTIASSTISFNLSTTHGTTAMVSVYDSNGKMLIRSQKTLGTGVNQQGVDVSNLRNGAYYFRIQNNEGTINHTQAFHKVD